jgi:hypothetical protein
MSVFNQLPVPSRNTGGSLFIASACGGLSGYICPEGKSDPGEYASVIHIYAADLTLEQTSQPTVTPGSVGGELADASKLSGTASVTFEAGDAGSGVYEASVVVDGKLAGSTALDSNGGHCVNVGQTTDGLPAFLYLKPCASAVSADVPLDTTSLSNGAHHIVVSVSDAAGNSTVVLDRTVEVANASPSSTPPSSSSSTPSAGGVSLSGSLSASTSAGAGGASLVPLTGGSSIATPGPPNGSPATTQAVLSAHWRSTTRRSLLGRWGRAQTIVGQLVSPAGAPIAGASLEAVATPSAQGTHASAFATVRTDAQGRFSVRLSGHSSSEQVAIAYRAHLGDPAPAAVSTLTLRVPASVSLRVSPRVSHVGGTIVFSGVLHGGSIPAGGKQLVLQAHAPGSAWRTFQVLSTNRRGRYRTSYRFRLAGPITYRFRVVSRQEADFPFATGASNVVAVWER